MTLKKEAWLNLLLIVASIAISFFSYAGGCRVVKFILLMLIRYLIPRTQNVVSEFSPCMAVKGGEYILKGVVSKGVTLLLQI
jgi:hypothetical protein